MLDLNAIHRARYSPSGKIRIPRFVGMSVLLLLASCVGGLVLMVLYSIVSLIPMWMCLAALVPTVIGMVTGWMVVTLVEYSDCRNPMVASTMGVICGAFVFLSACHVVGMSAGYRSGEPLSVAITRVDRIPEVIISRVYAPNVEKQRPDDFSRLNVFRTVVLLIEFGLLSWIPMTAGRSAAERAYDELTGRWFKRSVVRACPYSGYRIMSALQEGQDLTSTLASTEPCSSDPRPGIPKWFQITHRKGGDAAAAWMVFEYQGDRSGEDGETAYLTVTEINSKGKRDLVLQQLQLQSTEIVAANKLFLP